jgi:hypothetical protein
MRVSATALVALLLVTLGGCGAGDRAGSGRDVGAGGQRQSPDPGPSRSAGTSAVPLRVLVTYARQGGLAGLDERLTIWTDGSYELSRPGAAARAGRLTAPELARLGQVLDGAQFTRIPADSDGTPVADGFTYRVGYGGHDVVARDGAVPAALQPVITTLDEILARAT